MKSWTKRAIQDVWPSNDVRNMPCVYFNQPCSNWPDRSEGHLRMDVCMHLQPLLEGLNNLCTSWNLPQTNPERLHQVALMTIMPHSLQGLPWWHREQPGHLLSSKNGPLTKPLARWTLDSFLLDTLWPWEWILFLLGHQTISERMRPETKSSKTKKGMIL